MEELEKKRKKKHDHLLTKLLKFGIFAMIMLAPFLSVASKCLYVAFNKNAKDSYYGTYNNHVELIQTGFNNMIEGTEYVLKTTDYITFDDPLDNPSAIDLNVSNLTLGLNVYNDINVRILYYSAQNCIRFQINATSQINYYSVSNIFNYSFTLNNASSIGTFSDYINQYLFEVSYNNYEYLDNAFEYSINELNNNNLYNWSKNTAIYGAIETMTSGLGANDVLAMLLAYWSILTAIYIVFDIIIELFTYLTHLISSD